MRGHRKSFDLELSFAMCLATARALEATMSGSMCALHGHGTGHSQEHQPTDYLSRDSRGDILWVGFNEGRRFCAGLLALTGLSKKTASEVTSFFAS